MHDYSFKSTDIIITLFQINTYSNYFKSIHTVIIYFKLIHTVIIYFKLIHIAILLN